MKRPHLYLTGYRGCGKSTAGKLLSTRLNWPLCDLDRAIEAAAGIPIPQIFASEGEPGFRDRETQALLEVAAGPPQIIALGGGAILRPINRQTIARSGWCVWLDADPGEIVARLAADETTGHHRPSLTTLPAPQEIVSLMQSREPLYRETADLRIDTTGRTIDAIAEEIVAAWLSRDPSETDD